MGVTTWLEFIIGNSRAILRIAVTRHALWLGLLFVLAAGLAREYDAKDLSREPWFLVVPLVASLGTSFVLYSLLYGVGERRSVSRRPFWKTYRSFLTLYWMTAPLAFFYALPVERILSSEESTRANLTLLAIVSIWRVALMTRIVQVFFGAKPSEAFVCVMFFADTVALVVLYFTPLPIFNVMGGIPPSASEQMIQSAAFFVGCLGFISWFVWCASVLVLTGLANWQPPAIAAPGEHRVAGTLWLCALVMIVGWAPVLPQTQREQQLRTEVETALRDGRIREGISIMSSHSPHDFPPHWDPPPWPTYRDPNPPALDVVEVLIEDPKITPWVRDIFLAKYRSQISDRFVPMVMWSEASPRDKDRHLAVWERIPLTSADKSWLSTIAGFEDDPKRKDTINAIVSRLPNDANGEP